MKKKHTHRGWILILKKQKTCFSFGFAMCVYFFSSLPIYLLLLCILSLICALQPNINLDFIIKMVVHAKNQLFLLHHGTPRYWVYIFTLQLCSLQLNSSHKRYYFRQFLSINTWRMNQLFQMDDSSSILVPNRWTKSLNSTFSCHIVKEL